MGDVHIYLFCVSVVFPQIGIFLTFCKFLVDVIFSHCINDLPHLLVTNS